MYVCVYVNVCLYIYNKYQIYCMCALLFSSPDWSLVWPDGGVCGKCVCPCFCFMLLCVSSCSQPVAQHIKGRLCRAGDNAVNPAAV